MTVTVMLMCSYHDLSLIAGLEAGRGGGSDCLNGHLLLAPGD